MDIYYINLARRPDRRAFMEAQFEKLGLTATRIEAVTPADLSQEQRLRPTRFSTGRPLPTPALCCGLSHLKSMQRFLSTDAPWALILEDDAMLSKGLPAFLSAFQSRPPETSIIRIEAATRANLTLLPAELRYGGIGLHRSAGWDIGAAAYIVSRQGAELVLASPDTNRLDIDVVMFHDNSKLARRLRPLQANPGLCIQAGSHADLQMGSKADAHILSDLLSSRERPLHVTRNAIFEFIQRDLLQGSRKLFYRLFLGGKRMRVPFKPD